MVKQTKRNNSMIPSFLDDALGFNIYRASLLVRRELMQALSEYEMTPEQWTLMATLWSTERPLNQSEIAQLTLKDKHTVSRIIKRLERDGWIKKKIHPEDWRITMIQPTKRSMSFKEDVQKRLFSHFDDILKDFPDEEVEMLVRSLKKLRRTLGDQ